MGYVPAVFLLHHAKQLKLCLNYYAHTGTPGREAFTSPRLYLHSRCIVNDLRCMGM
jgi:hypothetical protein